MRSGDVGVVTRMGGGGMMLGCGGIVQRSVNSSFKECSLYNARLYTFHGRFSCLRSSQAKKSAPLNT